MVKKTIAEVCEINALAKKIDFEWRDTVLFIKMVEDLKAEGKQAEALKATKFAGPHNHL